MAWKSALALPPLCAPDKGRKLRGGLQGCLSHKQGSASARGSHHAPHPRGSAQGALKTTRTDTYPIAPRPGCCRVRPAVCIPRRYINEEALADSSNFSLASLHFACSILLQLRAEQRDGGSRDGAGEGEDSFRVSWSALSFRAGARPLVESTSEVPDLSSLSKLHFLLL